MAQPHPTLNEFFRWESQSWVEVVADGTPDEKAYFMPLESLQAYFAANDSRTLIIILSELFDSDFPPVEPELILRSHTAVFCILLRLGQGKCIDDFVRYEELSDSRLPFDPNHPPAEFSFINDDPTFLQRFCEKQWMYSVPVFDRHMLHKHFGRQRLLPITYKESLGVEGIASKSEVILYGPHNKLVTPGKDKTLNNPHVNTFVLKSYSVKDGASQYKEEVNGFRSVKQEDNIRKFYGSYIYGDHYNLLLEYPDKGTLEEYFQRETPPSRGPDIIKFWEGLFQLIKALKTIHSVRGSHQNVKPQNVLVISNGGSTISDCEFKFADFGLKHSHLGGKGDATVKESQDAATYGPPETYTPYDDQSGTSSAKISWEADIWSLGCIYSESAMWIADGYKGLLDYRRQRATETERILFKGSDCFHDGKRALESVIEVHRDIEDRLRRSDHITKDVLDSMVDEMLWEEDRPTAKALWRKAEMILQRAQQRLSSNSGDEPPRPRSRQNRVPPPSRLQPPTQPLPPIPPINRERRGLPSIVEKNYPPNVENWRSQVPEPRSRSHSNGPPSDISSPTIPHAQLSSDESVSDFDREITNSIASWQIGDNASSASPVTPFTSPHVSVNYDYQRNSQNEGRPRALRTQNSYEIRRPNTLSRGLSYASHNEVMEKSSRTPPLTDHPAYSQQDVSIIPPPLSPPLNPHMSEGNWERHSIVSDQRSADDTRTLAQGRTNTHSRGGSRHSIAFSTSRSTHSDPSNISVTDEVQLPPKSQKRMGGFTLFPTRSRQAEPYMPEPVETPPAYNSADSRRSVSSYSNSTPRAAGTPDVPSPQIEYYLSLNTCMEWKKAHKKVKKHSKVPPLPGANMLEGLKDRDHAFIIDDSESMKPVWHDVQRVFETLSYVVKGMSPSGTELFYTISYDTWRRKDTSELVEYVEKRTCAGETDISYRINLELQSYRVKLMNSKPSKGKKDSVRPKTFYLLTNGEWGPGPDPMTCIGEMAVFLEQRGTPGQVAIEFISFAQTAEAVKKVNDLASTEFAVDIVDCTPWTGNVLKMFKGALDKQLFAPAVEPLNELA